jgi:hypothetical protein
MSKTVSLPFEDQDGTLSEAVIAAMQAELCTSERDPNDDTMILLHFNKAADANAMLKAIERADVEDHVDPAPIVAEETPTDETPAE